MDSPSKTILKRFSRSVHGGAIKSLQLMAYAFVSQKKTNYYIKLFGNEPDSGSKTRYCWQQRITLRTIRGVGKFSHHAFHHS